MASGHARAVHERTGKRVMIVDYYKRPRWHEIWAGLPWIAGPKERGDFEILQNGPQCRPYIAYPFSRQSGQRNTTWRARDHIGAIALTDAEKTQAEKLTTGFGPFVVLEPAVALKANPNKQWGEEKWQALADLMLSEGYMPVQMTWPDATPLRNVVYVEAKGFRLAAAVLARARAAVLPEGGLHHAAAALGIPAVVLFGGVISPEVTGYETHINLHDTGKGSPCGMWMPCGHCKQIWAGLQPETVLDALHKIAPCPESYSVKTSISA